jgi:hypothetical protein
MLLRAREWSRPVKTITRIAALFLATGTTHAAARGQCRASDGVRVSFDWAAARLGIAIERVAEALLVEEEAVAQNVSGIVRAQGLVRSGP